MKTSKSKYRAAAEFDLSSYSLLLPLLEAVPHDQRTGAIVKGEHGLPIRERSYRKWFRQIARAAGIPDAVWSMDSRAGGATEAEQAGAEIDAIQGALTHSKKARRCATSGVARRRSPMWPRRATGSARPTTAEQRKNRLSKSRENRRGKAMENQRERWSGQQDSNLRPAVPKTIHTVKWKRQGTNREPTSC